MSQMDLSQQVDASDEDNYNDEESHSRDQIIGAVIQQNTSSTDDDDQFVDAVESFDTAHHHHHQTNGASSFANSYNNSERNYGILERCGRWLMAIPRDDVVALQRTNEYRDFLAAFDRLGEAHRRTVTLERQNHLMEREEDSMAEYSANTNSTLVDFARNASNMHPPASPTKNLTISSITATSANAMQQTLPHPLSPGSALRRRRYSFLQHLAVDDVLLRIFEFIDCSSLVRTGTTCHRFRELTIRSAEQRTQRLADGRLLRSAMKMLRAQEQIEGVGPREEAGPFVPIPMLGLRRRIKVSGAGDPEYNGIFFCTGSNGNGFLFTKPRSPERRVRVHNNPPTFNMQQLVEMDDAGGMEQVPVQGAGDHNDDHALLAAGGAVGLDANAAADENNDNGGINRQREDAVDILFGDEPNRSRLLRCVIAKRFSNETILWYMSKEVEDETTHEITQSFSFWAKLLVTGDATPDVCQYPSQTSILSQNGDPAWQPLTNTVNILPPVVDLLDG